MRDARFYSAGTGHAMQSLQKPFDLEKELSGRGFPIASHGRIDWDRIPEKTIFQVADDNDAAHAIASMIQDRDLAGETVVVWSDAGIHPMILDAATIPTFAVPICEEDWDCWIISVAGGWVIEKYHEGEVCFAPAPGVGPQSPAPGCRP